VAGATRDGSRPLFQRVAENVQICHDADAMIQTKALHLRRVEVPDIPRTQHVGPAVRGSVQDGIIGGIGQHEWPDYHRLNHVGHISQIAREACRFARGDMIARLQSRIQEYAFDLVKNESR